MALTEQGFLAQAEYYWKRLRITDRRRLSKRMRLLRELYRTEPERAEYEYKSFFPLLEKANARSFYPHAERLKCEFPEDLPITAKIPEIAKALAEHQVLIVCGATGSGKTTQLPKAALLQGFGRNGRIGCTQPRRIAASALAQRFASETDCNCGQEVGCKMRFDDRTSEKTVVKFMTDGILLAETRDDPNLYQYDCIILDEVHERSLNIDFLLGYMKLLLQKRRDLRLVISSATLESERLSDFFGKAPVIQVEGRLHPVEDFFLEPEEEEELSDTIVRGVEFLDELDPRGDILVFLPGEREIRDAAELLNGRRYRNTEVLPLFGRLSAGEQERIFRPGGMRRIILATNVAETSLTIPGIRFVVDSGLVRLSRYNPRSRIQELPVESISQASARQRRGRCGRLRDGVCVHLYSEESLAKADPYTAPEIQRSSLAGVILQMASLRLPPITEFPFVDPPSPALIHEGLRTLEDLHALEDGRTLTDLGYELASIPLDPHLGRILLESECRGVLPELAVIVSFLSIADPRERPFEQAKAADEAQRKFASEISDFVGILKLWEAVEKEFREKKSQQAVRRFAQKHFLNYRRLREWRNLTADLLEMSNEKQTLDSLKIDSENVDYRSIHMALLSGMPRQLAIFQTEETMYSDMIGKKFLIFPGSGLARRKNPPRWILFFALVETSRVFGRCVAEADPLWLEEVAPHLCKRSYDAIQWDEASGFVYAREKVTAGQLPIHPGRRRHYGKINPAGARKVFIQDGLVSARVRISGSWTERYCRMIDNLRVLETKLRRPDSLLDMEALYRHFDQVLPPGVCSSESLKRDWLAKHRDYSPTSDAILLEDLPVHAETDFPDVLKLSGQRCRLRYVFDPGEPEDGVTLLVPEHSLNLLSPYILEYSVPGYLEWIMDFLLRCLPKAQRKELMPLSETVELFMNEYRCGKIFSEQPFFRALAEFLEDHRGLAADIAVWENAELPEYLQMKLAVTGKDGNILHVYKEFPREAIRDSRISPVLSLSKKWMVAHGTEWPFAEPMPHELELSEQNGKKGYPALTEEDEFHIGAAVFLNEAEARVHHEQGLIRLTRIRFPRMMKQIKDLMKAPNTMLLSFFLEYKNWRDDLLNVCIVQSFGMEPFDIRSSREFEDCAEKSREELGDLVEKKMLLLEKLLEWYRKAEAALERIDGDSKTSRDAAGQLAMLFRPGFLLLPELLEEYPRYLKSLMLRLERAGSSSLAKDESKGKGIEEFVRKFHAALKMYPDLRLKPELLEYFRLLEEARIAAYTPEIPTRFKCSPEVLRKRWDEL